MTTEHVYYFPENNTITILRDPEMAMMIRWGLGTCYIVYLGEL